MSSRDLLFFKVIRDALRAFGVRESDIEVGDVGVTLRSPYGQATLQRAGSQFMLLCSRRGVVVTDTLHEAFHLLLEV